MLPGHGESRREAMVAHGDATAWGLCDGVPGDPRTGTGWRGALQAAADLSEDDPELLQIADEIHMNATVLTSPERLHAYVEATRAVATAALTDAFLRGMLLHLDGTDDG